jgi:spermidine/putrescine-binding protein
MDTANWLVPMDWSLLPTASETILPVFKDPAYDPHNGHSVPWQGGLTGVAYYPDKVGGTITSFDQLWDPKLAGHVGMLTEMVDTFGLTFLSMGVDPQQATADDGQKAADKLRQQRDAGIVRKYYGQDYIDDLARGDLWPVKGVQEIMQAKADDPKASAGDRTYYQQLATSPLLFPPEDLAAAKLHPRRSSRRRSSRPSKVSSAR